MSTDEPHPAKVWAGAIAFFGTGTLIGGVVAFATVQRDAPILSAIIMGAFAGAIGAWAVFRITFGILGFVRRLTARRTDH
jgi:hypothetical protein